MDISNCVYLCTAQIFLFVCGKWHSFKSLGERFLVVDKVLSDPRSGLVPSLVRGRRHGWRGRRLGCTAQIPTRTKMRVAESLAH